MLQKSTVLNVNCNCRELALVLLFNDAGADAFVGDKE